MKKVNFTADRVASFKCEQGKQQTIYWDAKTPGLGLRVTAAGAKSFIFESRLHSKTIRITIGDVKTWPIDGVAGDSKTARSEATQLKTLTDQGIDPREHKEAARLKADANRTEAMRRTVTLGKAWPIYIDANKSSWGARHLADHVRLASLGGNERARSKKLTMSGPLASLFDVPLSELSGTRIAEWLASESITRPTSTALSFRLLRAFMRWADGRSDYARLIPADAYRASAVKRAIPKAQAKDDCLQREQVQLWFDAVHKINNRVISVYLQGLLLTGARREELAGLRWADVDFQWKGITIRDKVEGQRTIPLTPYFAHLLSALPRRNQWVFSSLTSKNGRIADPRAAHVQALEVAGLPHVSLHGLRRSFGTLCEWVEVPAGISAQIMGHKPSAIAEKHYRRRPLDLLRMWHEKIEAWILEQSNIEFKPNEEASGLRVVA